MAQIQHKLNVLFSCGSASWGGLEIITLQTAQKLADRGANIKMLCAPGSKLEAEAQRSGLQTIPVFGKKSSIPSAVFKLKKLFKNSVVDVVHSHLSHDLWILTPALRYSRSNAKLFLTKHMESGLEKKDMLHRYLYNRVDDIFAISSFIKQNVINTCPVSPDIVHLIPDGIDLQKFDSSKIDTGEVRRSLGIPADRLLIGMAGRMTPGKGHEEFLESAAILNSEFPGKLQFCIIGGASFGEDNYEAEIRNLAQKLQIRNITFTGQTDKPARLIAAFDILSFPSHNESFGLVLIEAMALYVPAAASGKSGVLDIITDNETGLLFEPRNAQSQSKALARLIESSELRRKLASAARKNVEEKFDLDVMTSKLLEFYTK